MPFIQQIDVNRLEQPDAMPTYNVLLIGQSQSGKSTLLEAIKQYADIRYTADLSRIGRGNIAHTSQPRVEEIVTCLPIYKIYETNGQGRQEIDMEHYWEETAFDDFRALLKRKDGDGLEVIAEGSTSLSRFRIIDTPGLDDSENRDIEILGRIFSTLSRLGHLHLVVITDSHGTTLAPGYKAALQTYSTLFSTMHGLMVFAMTNIPNKRQHPADSSLDGKLLERSNIIFGIMGRRFPLFKIDCNLREHRPFDTCLTRNIIRDILATATIKTPVELKMQVHKTPSMKQVDDVIYHRYAKYFTAVQLNCSLLSAANRLQIEIDQQKSNIASKEDDLQNIDTDELLHLYEARFDQDWEHLYIIKPTLLQYSTYDHTTGVSNSTYPAVDILTSLDDEKTGIDGVIIEKIEEKGKEADGCIIDGFVDLHSGVDILETSGGKDEKYWRVLFRRRWYEKGYYHVVMSIKSRNKFRTRIDNLKREIPQMKEDLRRLEMERTRKLIELQLQGVSTTQHEECRLYQSLSNRLPLLRKMMVATKGRHLTLEVFVELALSGVYHVGSWAANAEALEQFWADKFGFNPGNMSTYQAI
ncbi:hypothetical protein BGZ88_002427 [Linnemannia elongata]|nr:hypothetical protein BGZ88_002427 [Linnemannia elongata]